MSDEHLRVLEAELEKRLDNTFVTVQRIQWIEDVDDEGEVIYIPVLDELGLGEDALVSVTWSAVDERGKAKHTQIINLELLEDVGAEELAEMLAPDLEHSYALLLAPDEEQE